MKGDGSTSTRVLKEDNETMVSQENEDTDEYEVKGLEESDMDIEILKYGGKKKNRDEKTDNEKNIEVRKNEHEEEKK